MANNFLKVSKGEAIGHYPSQPIQNVMAPLQEPKYDRARDKTKHHSKHSSYSSYPQGYPKGWSAWVWSDAHQKEHRARKISQDEYEYEYRIQKEAASSASATDSNSLAPIPDISASRFRSSMPQNQPSETDLMSSITRDLASYTLGTGSSPSQGHLTTKNPNTTQEDFDPNYRVHKQYEFRYGRIFKVLWTEPPGSGGGTVDSYSIRKGSFGEKFYEKVRRFVIIKQKESHCLCLPIMTYGGQGTKKHGVHPGDHAVIYSSSTPILLPGEDEKITKAPIKMNPYSPRHKLDRASRINFTKIYTVECNVKVWFIGEVDSDSEWRLQAYEQEHQLFQTDSNRVPAAFAQPKGTPGYSPSGFNPAYTPYAQNMPMTSLPLYPTGTGATGYLPSTQPSSETSYAAPAYPSSNPAWPVTPQSFQSSNPSVATSAYGQVQTSPYAINSPQPAYRQDREDDIYDYWSSYQELDNSRCSDVKLLSANSSVLSGSMNGTAADIRKSVPIDISKSTNMERISELKSSKTNHSRISSPASSLASLVFSYNSSFSHSQPSMTSGGDYPDKARDRFIALLDEDEDLQVLYGEALRKVDFDQFEKNFRRCLDQMSGHLRMEASSLEEKQTARFIRISSTSTARIIRDKLQTKFSSNETVDDRMNGDEDEDDDEDEDEDDLASDGEDDFPGEEIDDPLEHLEAFIFSSASFALLKESLRLFIHPDPCLLALSRAWPVTQPRSSSLTLSYDADWEVFDFLRSQFPEGQKLGDVQTLTGDAVNAQALSCCDYISANWNETGTRLLEGLEQLLVSTEGDPLGGIEHVETSQAKIDLRLNSDRRPVITATGPSQHQETSSSVKTMAITATATHAVHRKIISSLSWMCAAIRHSTYPEVVFSSASIETSKVSVDKSTIMIRLNGLQHLQVGTSCWHSLFPHGVIAKGFPIKHRHQGIGLEISLPDMALMSQSLSAVEFSGGLIFEGLRTILIPMQELNDDDALQWHFESKRDTNSRCGRSVGNVLTLNGIFKWHKELQLQRLIQRRCFLGWVEKASVILGTELYSTTEIRSSGVADGPNLKHVTSYNFTFGTSGMGFVTAEGKVSRERVAMPSRLTLAIDKDLYETFADDADAHILGYDVGQKIAWCLPQPSVVLYIIYAILRRRKFGLFDGDREVTLPYAYSSSDGATVALKILKGGLHYRVRKHSSDNEVVEEPLSKSVKQVWQLLNTVRTGLESATLEFTKIGEGPPKMLRGVEFTDVLKMSDRMGIKQEKVNEPWSHITINSASGLPVLFCKGLGQPIVPVPPYSLCNSWKAVPSGKNYLVLPGRAVKCFLEQNDDVEDGSCLAKKIQWVHDEVLVQKHTKGYSAVFHTQRLSSVPKVVLNKNICQRVKPYIDACFVFSNQKSAIRCSNALCNKYTTDSKSNAPITPGLGSDTHLSDLPESSSQTSSGTAKSFDPNGFGSGSSSSYESDDLIVQNEEGSAEPELPEKLSPQPTLPLSRPKPLRRRSCIKNIRSFGVDTDWRS